MKKLPYTSHEQREIDVWGGRGLVGRRTKGEKNVIGEEENEKLLLFLPPTSFPIFLPKDDSSPPRV